MFVTFHVYVTKSHDFEVQICNEISMFFG